MLKRVHVLVSSLAAGIAAAQTTEKPGDVELPENPLFTVSPNRVARGKDYNIVVRSKNKDCDKLEAT